MEVIPTCWVWTVTASIIGSTESELWPSDNEGASSVADDRTNDFLNKDVLYDR